jgi:hypothetical protein
VPAFCAVNGLNVIEGAIFIPRIGVWHADLSVDAFQAPSGAATIRLASQTLAGKFVRAGLDLRQRLQVRVVGGAGGLATPLAPRSYGSIPLKVVLQDALRDAGEVLSPTADASLLATQLTAWSRMAAPASSVVAQLLQAVPNAVWRVLVDGTVWCGFESWPASSLPDTVPIQSEPELGRVTIASDAPAVLPGTTFQYRAPGVGAVTARVGYVQHHIRRGEVRTVLLTES